MYDDGGEDYDWSSTRIILPEGKDPTKWLQESIKADDERETSYIKSSINLFKLLLKESGRKTI